MRLKKKVKKEKVVKAPEVVVEISKEPIQEVCKSAGCSRYAVKDGLCQNCINDLSSIGYK